MGTLTSLSSSSIFAVSSGRSGGTISMMTCVQFRPQSHIVPGRPDFLPEVLPTARPLVFDLLDCCVDVEVSRASSQTSELRPTSNSGQRIVTVAG
jgi:hypothetical protein